ncbi:MAG: adenosylcobinamide amidohydrolase [Desulfurococcales archaeon]|nr:adenosylcobinamide amidohydrolase [Desulfurococcales archaeon]
MYPRIDDRGDLLVVDLGGEYKVASTAVNGGLRWARYILVKTVEKDFNTEDYNAYTRDLLRSQNLPGQAIVMLTAVDVGKRIVEKGDHTWVLATVGLTNPACIEMEELYRAPPISTINLVVVSLHPLSDQALLDLLRVAAEAKAAAVTDILPWCTSRPLGTSSDAITVAAPPGRGLAWSGLATIHGNEAARLVWRAVVKGDNRSVDERLKGILGVSIDELVDDATRLYRAAPIPGVSPGKAREAIRREMARMLKDPNLWTLLTAAREADLHARASSIPGLAREEYLNDTKGLVADEVLAAGIALYLQGWKGLMAAYWVDREKTRLGLRIADLPGLLDDAAAALIGSALSRVYDKLLQGEEG